MAHYCESTRGYARSLKVLLMAGAIHKIKVLLTAEAIHKINAEGRN